jgi:hypothetical protein
MLFEEERSLGLCASVAETRLLEFGRVFLAILLQILDKDTNDIVNEGEIVKEENEFIQ